MKTVNLGQKIFMIREFWFQERSLVIQERISQTVKVLVMKIQAPPKFASVGIKMVASVTICQNKVIT